MRDYPSMEIESIVVSGNDDASPGVKKVEVTLINNGDEANLTFYGTLSSTLWMSTEGRMSMNVALTPAGHPVEGLTPSPSGF